MNGKRKAVMAMAIGAVSTSLVVAGTPIPYTHVAPTMKQTQSRTSGGQQNGREPSQQTPPVRVLTRQVPEQKESANRQELPKGRTGQAQVPANQTTGGEKQPRSGQEPEKAPRSPVPAPYLGPSKTLSKNTSSKEAKKAIARFSTGFLPLNKANLGGLPLDAAQKQLLEEGRRRPYYLFRLDAGGGLERQGRVHTLLLLQRATPRTPVTKRKWGAAYEQNGTRWLPLMAGGKQVGALTVGMEPAVSLDTDGDGVVEFHVSVGLNGGSQWMVLDTPSGWRLFDEIREGRGACGVMGLQGKGRKAPAGMGDGFLDATPHIKLCQGAGGGGRGIGSGRGRGFGVSEKCKRLLASGSCPARNTVGGWNADPFDWNSFLRDQIRDKGIEKVLKLVLGGAASRAFSLVSLTKDIGDFLNWWAEDDYQRHYVNEADLVLHKWEQYVRDSWGSLEAAERAGVRPNRHIVRAACRAGSQSMLCGGPDALGERSELPKEKQRSAAYWEHDDPDIDGTRRGEGEGEQPLRGEELAGGMGVKDIQCRACQREAAWKQAMDQLSDDARSRCSDPRSQPNPAAQQARSEREPGDSAPAPNPEGSWWGGVRGPTGEVECAAHGRGREETRPPTLEELQRSALGCANPTARPVPEGGAQGQTRCRLNPGANANVPTIGIAYATVFGFGPCAEEICQGNPSSQ